MDALLFGHRSLEACALFGDVREFTEGVRQFDPAYVKLETFGDLVAAGLWPRQCGQRQWILI